MKNRKAVRIETIAHNDAKDIATRFAKDQNFKSPQYSVALTFEKAIGNLKLGLTDYIVVKENDTMDMTTNLSKVSGIEIAERVYVDDSKGKEEIYFIVKRELWPKSRLIFVGTMITLPVLIIAFTIAYFTH